MKWRPWIWQKEKGETDESLGNVQRRFARFLSLLDANNRVLKLFSDLEEKAHGDYLFDINYLRSSTSEIRRGVQEIIDAMISLGGEEYAVLRERFDAIDRELAVVLTGNRPVPRDEFVVPFDRLDRDRSDSVGGKNAQLGEMTSRLKLPVPGGFAITAWAYKHFVDANELQRRIDQSLEDVDLRRYEDLVWFSKRIQKLVLAGKVPDDLSEAIRSSVRDLQQRTGADRFALRSSALGEDSHFSFAGQYRSILNVRADEVVERYREVLASKFTPKAISYLMSHAFRESELAMCVGCISMVDAQAAGVLYTRNPVRPDDECVVVNSILGLGQLLVDGTLTPDVFRIDRRKLKVVESVPAIKCVRLVMRPDSGTTTEILPETQAAAPSVDERTLVELARLALQLEEHYGEPQDVEWAVDREGSLALLQTRPLQMARPSPSAEEPDLTGLEVVLDGGVTVCPGAGAGPVYHASSSADLPEVPEGCVLIARHPFPGLFAVRGRLSALVTEVGGVASHVGTLAREYGVPTVMGLPGACGIPAGDEITVDATEARLYAGRLPHLVEARRLDVDPADDDAMLVLLKRLLAHVSPLNLLHPADPGFVPRNCRTLHDITRFCHQRALQEILERASGLGRRENIGLRLKSDIPLPVKLVYLDQNAEDHKNRRFVEEQEITSEPMRAFWSGVTDQGWPAPPRDPQGPVLSVTGVGRGTGKGRFAEDSYAILSREYMIVSLRMGYHFTTIEAMCTDEPNKNFVGLQLKEGGATLDRRLRRLTLMTRILSALGFENASKGDFLDSHIAYLDRQGVQEKLRILGRLTIMTKQLDMVLSNEAITDWYTRDFMRKLGLDLQREKTP